MMEPNRKLSIGSRQWRGQGNCRGLQYGTPIETGPLGRCGRFGFRHQQNFTMPPAESVVESDNRLQSSDLPALRAQVERMKKALENIEEQIRVLTED